MFKYHRPGTLAFGAHDPVQPTTMESTSVAPQVIAIHGGCGVLPHEGLSPSDWHRVHEALATALRAGWVVMRHGGSSLDAVQAAVVSMEDEPFFNAGHGAALNADGIHELDASIMDGSTVNFGGVIGVRRIRNPVKGARAVIDDGTCVLRFGEAADRFAQAAGLEMVEKSFFTTAKQSESLRIIQQHVAAGTLDQASEAAKHGTVGAVALDRRGDLAAATSTGGGNNKPSGRVGDSPIAGAGTYARNGVCAISCTGKGEVFLRLMLAHEIAARIEHARQSLAEAAATMIHEALPAFRIGGGLVGVDPQGNVVAPFSTQGMYRGWISRDGDLVVATHRDTHPIDRLT
jgi:beta-aspartyl-peptidase (threonine type)